MWLSMANSFSLMGKMRSLLPFSECMYTLRCSWLMSIHFVFITSPIRAPVSFRNCITVAVFGLPEAISESISFSVGI